jgi:hypothetical protein
MQMLRWYSVTRFQITGLGYQLRGKEGALGR